MCVCVCVCMCVCACVCIGKQAVYSDAFMNIQHTTFVKSPFVFTWYLACHIAMYLLHTQTTSSFPGGLCFCGNIENQDCGRYCIRKALISTWLTLDQEVGCRAPPQTADPET